MSKSSRAEGCGSLLGGEPLSKEKPMKCEPSKDFLSSLKKPTFLH